MAKTVKTNCGGKPSCGCKKPRKGIGHSYRSNFAPEGKPKRIRYEGRETLVVPVIMARADVVMNGSWVPVEELIPETWNGVPVTVGHPEEGDGFTSANLPEVLTDWSVGRIFNAVLDGEKLKAEAWIDVKRANAVAPDLVAQLEAGAAMDVSTGYFCDDEPAEGTLNGKAYTAISRNLRPDHLALLPGEEGACNWGDGCGVRSNRRALQMKVQEALKVLAKAVTGNGKAKPAPKKKGNERGSEDDLRQMVADLISQDSSPFTPDDEDALRSMSEDTLRKMRDQYVKAESDDEEAEPETATEEVETEEEDTEVPAKNEGDQEDKPVTPQKKGKAMTAKNPARVPALNAEDRAALDFARRTYGEHKAALVSKVVANSAITKEQAEAMPVATLEVIANGLKPAANYAGRAVPAGEPADKAAEAMSTGGVVEFIRNKKKGA